MAYINSEARRRRLVAKRLHLYLKRLGLHNNLKQVSRATGIDMDVLRHLATGTPKIETLEKISEYVEKVAREHSAAARAPAITDRDSGAPVE